MKRKNIAKRIISAAIAITALLSTMTIGHANQEINLNHGNVEFNNLLIVENGITYIPLRLAFNRNISVIDGRVFGGNNPDYDITVEPFIDQNCVTLGLIRKDENGNVLNEGRYVEISWSADAKEWASRNGEGHYGWINYVPYDVINGTKTSRHQQMNREGLKAKIKLVPVNDQGDRLFVSMQDLQSIIDFMTDGSDYQVDIID